MLTYILSSSKKFFWKKIMQPGFCISTEIALLFKWSAKVAKMYSCPLTTTTLTTYNEMG